MPLTVPSTTWPTRLEDACEAPLEEEPLAEDPLESGGWMSGIGESWRPSSSTAEGRSVSASSVPEISDPPPQRFPWSVLFHSTARLRLRRRRRHRRRRCGGRRAADHVHLLVWPRVAVLPRVLARGCARTARAEVPTVTVVGRRDGGVLPPQGRSLRVQLLCEKHFLRERHGHPNRRDDEHQQQRELLRKGRGHIHFSDPGDGVGATHAEMWNS